MSNKKSPVCYLLVGVPGSGKSTWIAQQRFAPGTVVASTDNYIDRIADQQGKTYSEVFKEHMPAAVNEMAKTVLEAVKAKKDIIWDQTSVTRVTRAKKFRMLPESYEVIGVVFRTPARPELLRRLKSRPGKMIPQNVMDTMIHNWQEPAMAEGFYQIIYV
jgi:predicted kinase